MKDIIECCGSGDICLANPMNTLGAGNVDPLNADPVPDNQIPNKAKNKKKKHSMKSLKEYIKSK